MRSPPVEPPSPFFITSALLAEIGLLFDNRSGGTLPNGYIDAGYNCYAKAFVTSYLARLQGLEADLHEGRGLMVLARGENSLASRVDPHAWATLRSNGVIDLSIGNFGGRRHFTCGHRPLKDAAPVRARLANSAQEFERFFCFLPSLPRGGYLFLHSRRRRPFRFADIREVMPPINSPPTRAFVDRYLGTPVIAKAVLHLHHVIGGRRATLPVRNQDEAWARLAAWPVDALGELERTWDEATGRSRRSTSPAPTCATDEAA